MRSGQSVRLKRAFLEHFREHGNITAACRAVGITRRGTVYDWQEKSDDFAAAFREAEIEATETLEAEARRRAVGGVVNETPVIRNGEVIYTITETKYSDTLLIFLLKARAPTKYRDNSHVELTGKDGGPLEVADDPRERLARRLDDLAARVGAARVTGAPQPD
jgi:hypothetical protein